LIQIFLGLLDLAGVAAVGVLGALAVSGVASRAPGSRIFEFLSFLNIESASIQYQAMFLGLLAAGLLIAKTFISIVFSRKIIFFLSRRGSVISSDLISKLLSQPLQKLQAHSLQENLYSVTSGVSTITIGVLATSVNLLADISLLIIMCAGLFVVDTLVAVSTLGMFGLIGFLLYKLMNQRARELGISQAELMITSNQRVSEIIGTYREAVVKNRRAFYAQEIGRERLKLSDVAAEIAFMPNISKYVIELTVVLGALGISALQFSLRDASQAVAVLSVFLAASTRIAPAVLRVQQGAIGIRASLGSATPTLELVDSLSNVPALPLSIDFIDTGHSGFVASVTIKELSLTYPTAQKPSVENMSLEISEGESVAIVGPSGAGKTTLVDIILGVLHPDSGVVRISGNSPIEAIVKWPGALAYVPQDVLIIHGSIRENVALGYSLSECSDELIWDALKVAQLEEFVKNLPDQLSTPVGDRGVKISGGQRQRLGIARAMLTKPKLLVLDEATSSLDGQTEADVSSAVQAMHGSVTVIMIAHRLSTVRNVDRVVYLSEGKLLAEGSFESVREVVPDFDEQAKLMGL
jgi:ABC-type multidrug transport system fused ATPase/permease subunit